MSNAFRIHLDLTDLTAKQLFELFDQFIQFIESCKLFFGGGCRNDKICGIISGCDPHVSQPGLCKCGEEVATCTIELRQKIVDWCLSQNMIVREASELFDDAEYIECGICHAT